MDPFRAHFLTEHNKAHKQNIHALNSHTHTLRIQFEYTQKQCMGVANEGIDIKYMGITLSMPHRPSPLTAGCLRNAEIIESPLPIGYSRSSVKMKAVTLKKWPSTNVK